MSAETKTALDQAISAHVADEKPGHYVSGYALQVVGTNLEDSRSWYVLYSPSGQPFHVTAGLTTVADMTMSELWQDDSE